MPQPSAVTPLADPAGGVELVGAGPFTGVPSSGVQVSNALSGIVQAGAGITGTTLASATVLQGSINDVGVRRRTIYLVSTCNQPVHFVLQLVPASPGTTGASVALDLTIAAGNTNPQRLIISSGGAALNDGNVTAPVVSAGAYAALDCPAGSLRMAAYAAVAPVSGTLSVDVVELSS
ncbi:MAG: hypothetical protein ACYDCQ_08565 [Dehalococcoidia bacterium]